MPIYIWKGINIHGEKRKGQIEAVDEAGVRAHLKRLRIEETSIREKPKDLLENIKFFRPKVKGKDVVVFTRQLYTKIDSGLPLVQCIQIMARQQDKPTLKEMLTAIQADVETGTTLADSMRKHPKVYDSLYCNMIEAGELGGILDTILQRLATFKEKAMALQKRIKGAMTYPAICLGICLLVLAVILIFVVPVFDKMFKDFGSTLPAPTQMVVNLSNAVKSYWWAIFGIVLLFIWIFKKYYNTERGRLQVDHMLLWSPVIGDLVRKVAVSKFTRTLSTMLQSGVPILDALGVVARTAGNKVIERAIVRVSAAIAEGRPIAEPLEESQVFPPMVVQMINVGESVGALDTMLEKVADFYDAEVDQAVDNLTAMIEPFMMVFLGGVIGGLVVAMYLPIFQIASVVA